MTTMRVGREGLLTVLESVAPGLASRETIQQSTCFAFTNGKVMTFNDDVACAAKSPLKGVEGAVPAQPVLDLLSKLKEDEIEIEVSDSEFLVRGKRRKSGITMEKEVLLPVEVVDDAGEWKSLPDDFSDAVGIVKTCASNEASQFVLTCVHITPTHLEACDRFQIARYPVKLDLETDTLVRAESLAKMQSLGMTEFSVTDSWMHFKNESDLVVSCRRDREDYHSLDKFLEDEDCQDLVLPAGLEEVVDKAEIFSSSNSQGNAVILDIRDGKVVVEGRGSSGWYKELKKVSFDGDPVKFSISPKLLVEVAGKSNECKVSEGKLSISAAKFKYVTCTSVPEE